MKLYRKRRRKTFKYILRKIRTFITNIFLGSLIIAILIIPFWYNFYKKNNNLNKCSKLSFTNLNDIRIEKIKTNIKATNNYLLYAEEPEIENYSNKENDTYDAEKIEEIVLQTDSYLVLEIANMLEKFNITYEELLEYVTSIPAYNYALQNVFNCYPNLDLDKLIEIIQGKTTKLRENLYIGDSRTQGMLLSGVIGEENSVYGVGYGYKWLIGEGDFSSKKTNALNGAINVLETKMSNEELYNIVIWLGVNDYTYIDANKYFKKYEELVTSNWSNYNIYIVSVGPVKDSKAVYVSNSGINNFNDSLKELVESSLLNNLRYIDLNLNEDSINKYDAAGLHYGEMDYQNIFNIITETITNDETNDINNILIIFYCALKSYDSNFNYTNEIEAKIKKLENKIANN